MKYLPELWHAPLIRLVAVELVAIELVAMDILHLVC